MKKCSLITALILTGCTTMTTSMPVGAETCYVRDLNGRTWSWSSPRHACSHAVQACEKWHYNHGIFNGRCMVQ